MNEALLIVDFDNTIYYNPSVKVVNVNKPQTFNLFPRNLRLRELYLFKRDNVKKVICTGRSEHTKKAVMHFVDNYSNKSFDNFYFLNYDDIEEDLPREEFHAIYWTFKWMVITELRRLHGERVIVIDDDQAICGMCARFEIPNVLVDINANNYRIYRNGFYKKFKLTNLKPMFEFIDLVVAI